jgi:uncharacterized protein
MEDLIEDWKQNAKRKEDATFDFLLWLKTYKSPNQVDRIANESHEEVFSCIDCTNCANCCKTLSPQVSQTDIKRISAFLQISETEFIEKYLKIGDENKYEMNALPCPFLKDDKCSIYEVRPTVCREYPHTDKKGFTSRKYMHIGNTEICPAVYHILETMKNKFGWRDKK